MTNLLVGGIVLAAGASRRMGSPKAFLRLHGTTFLDHALGLLEAVPCPHVVIVCPPGRKKTFEQYVISAAQVVENPLPERGMLSSLSIGFDTLPEEAIHALVTLVDTPLIQPETVAHLLAQCVEHPNRVIVPIHKGEPGHPILIPRSLWAPISAWRGPMGARGFLMAHPHVVTEIVVPDPGILRDFDTPQDLSSIPASPETPPH